MLALEQAEQEEASRRADRLAPAVDYDGRLVTHPRTDADLAGRQAQLSPHPPVVYHSVHVGGNYELGDDNGIHLDDLSHPVVHRSQHPVAHAYLAAQRVHGGQLPVMRSRQLVYPHAENPLAVTGVVHCRRVGLGSGGVVVTLLSHGPRTSPQQVARSGESNYNHRHDNHQFNPHSINSLSITTAKITPQFELDKYESHLLI